MPASPNYKELLNQAVQLIQPYVHRTPVLSSNLLDELAGANIHFKCENFQRMGAFKMRGAIHAILRLNEEQRAKGVVTHSSGNFAQAVSLGARSVGCKAYIVMPSNAPEVKKMAVKSYGGILTFCTPTLTAREEATQLIATNTGATLLHPSNDLDVILGQGTAAIELLEDHPDLDVILTPVGGGGLLAGCSLAAHYFGRNCSVIAGEPAEADDAYRSLKSGQIETNATANTVADGLRTTLGDINFPIIKQHVSEIILVSEEEIIRAMRLIWERMKIIIEPSSAVPFAALLKVKDRFQGKQVGVILSGGNVDVGNLPF